MNLQVEVDLLNVPGEGAVFGEDFGAVWTDDSFHPVGFFDVLVQLLGVGAIRAAQGALPRMVEIAYITHLLFLLLFLKQVKPSFTNYQPRGLT